MILAAEGAPVLRCIQCMHSLAKSICSHETHNNYLCLSLQSASVGGAAHLVNFRGTATVASLIMARSGR